MSTHPEKFSNLNRKERLKEAVDTFYDLIVIGGGITGAGIALDASLRGLKVLLVEKLDFASGTSSKSTKLIHGGLRYLKQLEFGLVRETGLERAIAHNNAAHLVHPENMLLPIVDDGTFNALSAGVAIGVYDRLSSVKKEQRRKTLNKKEVERSEPLLNKDILKSGIMYSEYRTDDSRLTIEIIKAAVRNGASAFNYLEVVDFNYTDGKVSGVICHDDEQNQKLNFKAKTVVNASGPWVDVLRMVDNEKTETNLQLSKGIHLVFDREKLPVKNSLYYDTFDGRMIFTIPRGGFVYAGTTDTFYNDDKDKLRCTKEDVDYILSAVNNMFDIPSLSIDDVKSNWVGIRPLIRKKGKGPSELSRKDEIFTSDTGLISIAGGKLTGFRKMAERVVDLVSKTQKINLKPCKTKHYKIHHNSFKDYLEYKLLSAELGMKYPDTDKEILKELLNNFGKDSISMLEGNDGSAHSLLKNQLDHCIAYESVYLPLDFINRRTGWLYFGIDRVSKDVEVIVKMFASAFKKDQKWIEDNLEICIKAINQASLKNMKNNNIAQSNASN